MYKVTLLSYTPDPQKAVSCAAKLCYSDCDIDDLREKITDDAAAEFVDMLSRIGHESPIEHVNFTFGIEGVSRSFLAQMTRHRIASYSVQSQRYVEADSFEYVIPPEIENDPVTKEQYINIMNAQQEAYDSLSETLKKKHINTLVSQGEDQKTAERKAEKMAIEDARFVLPNACATKMIVTMNARSLMNFFKHRCCNRAQWEIQRVADDMLRHVCVVAPNYSKMLAHRVCVELSEGKMTCGKVTEVRLKYKNLKENPSGN